MCIVIQTFRKRKPLFSWKNVPTIHTSSTCIKRKLLATQNIRMISVTLRQQEPKLHSLDDFHSNPPLPTFNTICSAVSELTQAYSNYFHIITVFYSLCVYLREYLIKWNLPIWIGHVNRMDSKRKVRQIFNNNLQGSRQRGRQKKTDCGIVYKPILINSKLQTRKGGKKNRVGWKSIKQAKVRIGL
jgi:hypothetical protein